MRLRQSTALFSGTFFVALSTVALSIVLTRLFSAILGHHLAFLAISLSMFGVGVGGLLTTVFPRWVRTPHLFSRLGAVSGLAVFAVVIAGVVLLRTKPVEVLAMKEATRLAILYGACAVPFTLSGVVVAGALSQAPGFAPKLYFVDMLGAAIGAVLSIPLLRIGAPRALLAVGIGFGIGAVLYLAGGSARKKDVSPDERAGHPGVAMACALASITMFLGDVGEPYFKLAEMRYVQLKSVELQKWSELALVTVDRPVRGTAWMRMDGSAATAILDEKTVSPKHPDEMAYVLSKAEGPSIVIGAGGGRDVRVALRAGQKDITAVEINRVIVDDVMLGKFKEFSGGLYEKPEVHVAVADGRSFIRAGGRKYRNMVMSLVDTWAASSVGALALSENGLYTAEAFRDFVGHLTDDGTLVVNRWDGELDRIIAVAAAGLALLGVSEPRKHFFSCSSQRSTALLIKRTPLLDAELKSLRDYCRRNGFREMLAPDVAPATPLREALANGERPESPDPQIDLSPPTDDRPFFFFNLPPNKVLAALSDPKKLAAEQQGLITLFAVFVVSTVISTLFLLVPSLVGLFRRRRTPGRVRVALYFSAIGAGFVLVEIALIQTLSTFLGHPFYGMTVGLGGLLFATGLGSLFVSGVTAEGSVRAGAARAQILAILLVGCAFGLMLAFDFFGGHGMAMRVVVSLVAILPLGLLMGGLAPLGVRAAAVRSPELVTWSWGLNGFFAVVATSAGTLLAMTLGYSTVFIVGAVVYFAASLALPGTRRDAA